MKRVALLTLMAALVCVNLSAADRDFSNVVDAISDEFHTRPKHIPFLGLVNVVTAVAHPAGTKHVDLAIFDNLDQHTREGQNILTSLRHAVGPKWNLFFLARSIHHGDEEDTLIYLREDGKDWKLLLTTVQHEQAVVVQLQLNTEALQRWINSPQDSARHWNGEDTGHE